MRCRPTVIAFMAMSVSITLASLCYATPILGRVDHLSALSPPVRVIANAEYNYVEIKWTAVPNASYYTIYRASTKDGPYTFLKRSQNNFLAPIGSLRRDIDSSLDFYDGRNTTNTIVYYVVTATDKVGNESKWSNPIAVSLHLIPPPILITNPGNHVVGLTWDMAMNVSGYNIYRSTRKGGGYVRLTKAPVTSETLLEADTPFRDRRLINGKPYYYVVTSVNTTTESAFSNEAIGVPAAPRLTKYQAILSALKFCNAIKITPVGSPCAVYPIPSKLIRSEMFAVPQWQITYTQPDGTVGVSMRVVDQTGDVVHFLGFSDEIKKKQQYTKPITTSEAVLLSKSAMVATGMSSEFGQLVCIGRSKSVDGGLLYSYVARRRYRGLPFVVDQIEVGFNANTDRVEALDVIYHHEKPCTTVYTISAKQALATANNFISTTDASGLKLLSEYKAIAAPNSVWSSATRTGPNRPVWAIVFKIPGKGNYCRIVNIDAQTDVVIGGV